MPFEIAYLKSAGAGVMEEVLCTASTQFTRGMMLFMTAGRAGKVTVSAKGTHLYQAMTTPPNLLRKAVEDKSTTVGELAQCMFVAGDDVVLKSSLTGNSAPPINGAAANTNATATSVLVTVATTDGDYTGGQIYCPELDEQRLITNSDETGGVTTFTVDPPFRRAVTLGDTVRAVPFSKGNTAVKYSASTPENGIGTAVLDKTGGFNKIEDVDLKNLIVYSSCPNLI